MTDTKKLTFIRQADEGFLIIVLTDRQEEIEAPFCVYREDGFFIVDGINNEQKVTYIIPDTQECYFEMRTDLVDDDDEVEDVEE